VDELRQSVKKLTVHQNLEASVRETVLETELKGARMLEPEESETAQVYQQEISVLKLIMESMKRENDQKTEALKEVLSEYKKTYEDTKGHAEHLSREHQRLQMEAQEQEKMICALQYEVGTLKKQVESFTAQKEKMDWQISGAVAEGREQEKAKCERSLDSKKQDLANREEANRLECRNRESASRVGRMDNLVHK
jgi:chromosome segregation ATPase